MGGYEAHPSPSAASRGEVGIASCRGCLVQGRASPVAARGGTPYGVADDATGLVELLAWTSINIIMALILTIDDS